MKRANYEGSVRNSSAEAARDQRMLVLTEQGLDTRQIAERMGLGRSLVSKRVARARAVRDAAASADAGSPDWSRSTSSREDAQS